MATAEEEPGKDGVLRRKGGDEGKEHQAGMVLS